MSVATPSLPLNTVTADQLKQQMINIVKANFTNWSDLLDSNNMIVLIELFANICELNYAYQNRNARECFLQFALDPRNVLALAKDRAYTPAFQSPSFVPGTISSNYLVTQDTPIPIGTQFSTTVPGLVYETTVGVTIPAGHNLSSSSTVFNQQQSWVQNFTGNGAGNQTVVLAQAPVMPSTISVVINGITWNYTETFVDANSTTLAWSYSIDQNGVVTIVFGDGTNGAAPALSGAGVISYKTGGGSKGAVGAGQILQNITPVLDAGNHTVLTLTANTIAAATPGADKETPDQIRVNAPANLKAPITLLTTEDVTAAVKTIPGVGSAIAVNWETDPAIPRHLVNIFIYPTGGGTPTSGLMSLINSYLTVTKPVVMGAQFQLINPVYNTINFVMTLVVKPNFTHAQVATAIQNTLIALFDPTQTNIWGFKPDFGQQIYMSQILMILQQIDGVLGLTINTPSDQLLNYNQFPILGTVTVN